MGEVRVFQGLSSQRCAFTLVKGATVVGERQQWVRDLSGTLAGERNT